jgi:hypothetical protein
VHQWRFVLLSFVGFGVLVVVVAPELGCTATCVMWYYCTMQLCIDINTAKAVSLPACPRQAVGAS